MKWNNSFVFNGLPTDATGKIAYIGEDVAWVESVEDIKGDAICISSLTLPDEVIDACIEYVLENKPKLYVVACVSLGDVGIIEARFHLSPIMLLHKLGLLDQNCTIVGANYLDNDDVDLMAQCGASVVLCPSYSLGGGYGFPNVVPLLKKLNEVTLGTFDNQFNASGSVMDEARLLYLGTACSMRSENALTLEDVIVITGFTVNETSLKKLLNI